jgi:hypothetical protein
MFGKPQQMCVLMHESSPGNSVLQPASLVRESGREKR